MTEYPQLHFHGGTSGVSGSCYELRVSEEAGILIDCGLFQGAEERPLEINFPVDHINALLVTQPDSPALSIVPKHQLFFYRW